MNKIQLSVLVANYNNENYLADAIKSIYSQQCINFNYEVIVCDDASTDRSLCILEELKSQFNFSLLVNRINRGVGFTKKKLVSESQGNYFNLLWKRLTKKNKSRSFRVPI
jgi:glycosyltransferase involved in cell wall biosynthesis